MAALFSLSQPLPADNLYPSVAGILGGIQISGTDQGLSPSPLLRPLSFEAEGVAPPSLLRPRLSPFSEGVSSRFVQHRVEAKETWALIANKYDISEDALRASNPQGSLVRGSLLVIPPPLGVAHKVEAGQRLEDIAAMYGVGVEDVRASNPGISPLALPKGVILAIPAPTLPRLSLSSAITATPPTQKEPPLLLPTKGKNWGVPHDRNAVDIANSCGADVVASSAGTVVRDALGDGSSGWNGGYGKFILLSHPEGFKTRYAHLSEVLVEVGDKVERGELIGRVGDTGRSTGCHVHFEVIGRENPFIK